MGKTEKEGKEKKIHQGFLDFSASATAWTEVWFAQQGKSRGGQILCFYWEGVAECQKIKYLLTIYFK